MLHRDERETKEADLESHDQKAFRDRNPAAEYQQPCLQNNPEYHQEWKQRKVAKETEAERCVAVLLCMYQLIVCAAQG